MKSELQDGSAAEVSPLQAMIAENIDQLVNLDISGYGVIGKLHEGARSLCSYPVALEAALRLKGRLEHSGYFFVTAGWILPGFYPYGETDGPLGAAALGRCLSLAFGARMVLLCEEPLIPMMAATCRAAGLNVLEEKDEQDAPRPPHAKNHHCIIVSFPMDNEAAAREATRLFDKYQPKALISIEKNGPNHEGRYAMVDGSDNSDCVAKLHHAFREADKRKVLTIGIGDRGNEFGFGRIADVPRRLLPFGQQATDTTEVDVLVTAAVSNWGASAIAANMALLFEKQELLHDPAMEMRMLDQCAAAGGIDGFLCRPNPGADGMNAPTHVAINTLLNELVRAPAARLPSVFSTPTCPE